MWSHVTRHFREFLAGLELTAAQHQDALTKVDSVGRSLCGRYYGGVYETRRVIVAGSYGKGTAVRPPSDVDLLFVLPDSDFFRFQGRAGNVQSQLLQEIRGVLQTTFPRTSLRGDGQVVAVSFDSYALEVVPAFELEDGRFLSCDTAGGGRWKFIDPRAEFTALHEVDTVSRGKTRQLIRMLKAWKRNRNVPIKSFVLEMAAMDFMRQWEYREHQGSELYYHDWMVRDFFAYLLRFENGYATVAQTPERLPLGDAWVPRCRTAHEAARRACEWEKLDMPISAANEWREIFGVQFPSS